MLLSAHAFKRFWDLHAWASVLGGLILHLMFLTGAISLFREELLLWQEPLAQEAPGQTSAQAALQLGLRSAPDPAENVWFYPSAHGLSRFEYIDPGSKKFHRFWVDGARGQLIAQRERLADFVFRLHFLSHEATGTWLYRTSGVLAVLLLLVIATGLLIHLKDIVRQFHQFRPTKSRRVLWSDMHKVLGVMGLPFQTMYAYTGAFIVLAPLVLGVFVEPVFGGDQQRAELVLRGTPLFKAEGIAGDVAGMLPLGVLTERAAAVVAGLEVQSYRFLYPGRANGRAEVRGRIRGVTPEAFAAVRLRATDGKVLSVRSPATESASGATWRWIHGLHFAHFGGLPLRFLFFVLALGTSATILTGNSVWLARRDPGRLQLGNRILARLSVGIGAGTLLSLAALFLVSRILPLRLAARGETEELVFLVALGVCIVWALAAKREQTLWWQQLGLAGLLLLPVPALAARWSGAGLFGTGPKLAGVVGVDAALLAIASGLCAAAFAIWRSSARRVLRAPARQDVERHAPLGMAARVGTGERDA